jgi:hypothetical protein
MDETIQIYFVYEVKEEEIVPAAYDAGWDTYPLKVTIKRFSAPYHIPLRGSLGSGHVIKFSPYLATNVKELGIIMPDVNGMLRSAEERGRREILDEFRKMSLRQIAQIVDNEAYEDYED